MTAKLHLRAGLRCHSLHGDSLTILTVLAIELPEAAAR